MKSFLIILQQTNKDYTEGFFGMGAKTEIYTTKRTLIAEGKSEKDALSHIITDMDEFVCDIRELK